MSKTVILLVALLVLTIASGPVKFRFGRSLAKLVRSQGHYEIKCEGGSGKYNVKVENLPEGWSQNGNVLLIPNILNLKATYTFRASVSDSEGNKLSENVILRINGVIIQA